MKYSALCCNFKGNTKEVGGPGSGPSPAAGAWMPHGQLQRAKTAKGYVGSARNGLENLARRS